MGNTGKNQNVKGSVTRQCGEDCCMAATAMDVFERTGDIDAAARGVLQMLCDSMGAEGAVVFVPAEERAASRACQWTRDGADFPFAEIVDFPAGGMDGYAFCDIVSRGEPAGVLVAQCEACAPAVAAAAMDEAARTFGSFIFKILEWDGLEGGQFVGLGGDDDATFSYVVDDASFRLRYISESGRRLFDGARAGEVCYQALYDRRVPCDYCPATSGVPTEKYSEKLERWMRLDVMKSVTGGKHRTLIKNTDISKYKQNLLETDALTGLPLYASFKQRVKGYLQKPESRWALLYVDLEKFSSINEKRGVRAGSDILKRFAELVGTRLQDDELICRYFSDVFLILVQYSDRADLMTRVQRFYEVADEWKMRKYPDLQLKIKMGVYPIGAGEDDVDEITERAAAARAARVEDADYAVYDYTMRVADKARKRIETMMADAIDNNEFKVYLQPKVEIATRRIVGAEALVRWISSDGRMMPAEFVPYFEKNGFIRNMDFYMSERVFRLIRDWIDEGKPVVPVSINIADMNISDPVFVETLKDMIKKYQIPPYTIELELREGMFTGSDEAVQTSMRALRRLGITFAVDDYGQGMSSINIIRKMPIDVVKLDKDFFDHVNISEQERVMLTHMVRMAKSLDMKVLFEGVETEEQHDVLRSTGCDMGQGYLYGKPMPVNVFQRLLARQN